MARTDGLRTLVEALDHEMARFRARGDLGVESTAALLASWAELIELVGLTPPPELRACPSCGRVEVRAATRCDRCGRRLEPLAAAASA